MSSMQEQHATREEHLRGIVSSQEIRKVGTGTTTRKTVQKTFWYAEQDADGAIMLQAINANFVPTGPKKLVSRDDLLANYSPEPEFYIQTVYPKMQELDKTIEKGDSHREKGETFSAEHEYSTALKVDEENVRANFGIGLTYLTRGEVDKADNIFGRLVRLDAAFTTEHKHLFNEFGINLRKNKMYTQAVDYYQRALTLSEFDDNLHVNIARALLEEQQHAQAVEHLLSALRLNPGNEAAVKFLGWMDKRKLIPSTLTADVSEILKLGVVASQTKDAPEEPESADAGPPLEGPIRLDV
jgi:tetratricopeptide (TPR) repeat protein